MSLQALDTPTSQAPAAHPGPARRQRREEDNLLLNELSPYAVVDQPEDDHAPVNLTTFGVVRETCPKCLQAHLNLILRQRNVRVAHLFCAACHSCFDAHYADGACALTI